MLFSTYRLTLCALVLVGSGLIFADDQKKPESERRPAPEGVEIVDLGTVNPKLNGYRAPKGFKVEIVAEAPTVINPVGMTFAEDGTPFVIEWPVSTGDREEQIEFKYKDGSKRKVAVITRRVKDVIKTLQINDKGIYDKAKVVLEEEMPSTILLHDGWLYTASRGTVRRWKPSKPDGAYDVKEVIAQGFSHQVSGLAIGNDGQLYISSGDDDNVVEGSDGSRATALRTGAIFRCRPDGSKMEVYSIGYRNPYRDVAFDAAFNLFHVDGDTENGCRLMHITEGSDFGWRRSDSSFLLPPSSFSSGKVPPLLKSGRGAPAGLLIYNDAYFPEAYRGLLYYPDVMRRSIWVYRVARKGTSFKVTEEFELLSSSDPLFRPCQLVTGPDGAMYVVDRRTAPDGKGGRIYRIIWGGTKEQEAIASRGLDSWAKIRKLGDAELILTLKSDHFTDRRVAQSELIKRGDRNRAALIKLLEDGETHSVSRLMALGALQSMWNADVTKAVRGRLTDQDPDLRRLAIDALGLNGEAKGVEAVGMLDDGDLDVRRAGAMALARTNSPGVADSLANALLADDTGDVMMRDGLIRALEMTGKTGVDRLLSEFESGDKKKINIVADTFLHLRTRPAAAAIPQLLTYPHLSAKQRADLVRSYTNYLLDPPVNLEPLVDYLTKNDKEADEVKLAGLRVLSLGNGPTSDRARKWRAAAREVAWSIVAGEKSALQSEAVLLLGSDAKDAKELGRRYLDKKLRRELLTEITDVLKRHAQRGDQEAEELLAKVMKLGLTLSNSPAEVARLREQVKSKGNPYRGRALYLDNQALACAKCHKLEDTGGNIGPDLTKLRQTLTLEKLVESMTEPSKEIKEGFQTFVVTTKAGQIHSGLKISQNAKEIVLRDVNGTDHKLAMAEVESVEKSTVSLMPDNVVTLLKYEEFLDLLAFLQSPETHTHLKSDKSSK